MTWRELLPFPLCSFLERSSSLKVRICLSRVSMDTVIDSTQAFWRLCAVRLHVSFMSPSDFPLALWFFVLFFFLATSSTQLEDLSFLNNQRAAGHRGSVRKHNTAGRPSDDVKGILRLNVESRSMCNHSFTPDKHAKSDLHITYLMFSWPMWHC